MPQGPLLDHQPVPSAVDPLLDPDPRLEIIERRRLLYDQLIWQIPGLAFAGQAFLLTVGLQATTTSLGRLLAGLFGLAAMCAVFQSLVKHRWTEEACSEWINWHELKRDRSRLTPRAILDEAFPDERPGRSDWETKRLRPLAKRSAFNTWIVTVGLFIVGDTTLVILAILGLTGVATPLSG